MPSTFLEFVDAVIALEAKNEGPVVFAQGLVQLVGEQSKADVCGLLVVVGDQLRMLADWQRIPQPWLQSPPAQGAIQHGLQEVQNQRRPVRLVIQLSEDPSAAEAAAGPQLIFVPLLQEQRFAGALILGFPSNVAIAEIQQRIPWQEDVYQVILARGANQGLFSLQPAPVASANPPIPTSSPPLQSPPGSATISVGGPQLSLNAPSAQPAPQINLNAAPLNTNGPQLSLNPGLPPGFQSAGDPGLVLSSEQLSALLSMSLTLQQGLRLQDVAAAAANDGRAWLACGRVTVFRKKGPNFVPLACSGEATISTRSAVIATLKKLVVALSKANSELIYEGDAVDLPQGVRTALKNYLSEASPRQLVCLPILTEETDSEKRQREEETPRPRQFVPQLLGYLVAEQTGEADLQSGFVSRVRAVSGVVRPSFQNSVQHETLFLLPVWRAIGKFWATLTQKRMYYYSAILAAIVLVIGALIFVPWEYRVEANGRMLPVDRRDVFVPLDSEVEAVLVKGGERVTQGQLLVQLRNPELEQQLLSVRNQRDEQLQHIRSLRSQIDQALKKGDRDAEPRLNGQLAAAQSLSEGFNQQLIVLEQRKQSLGVLAPQAGVVATFQADQLLRHRPVKRGEVLVTVMDDHGPWRLELEVAEDRMGHVLAATKKQPDLPLDFMLVTRPEQSYTGKLSSIATRAIPSEKQDLVVEAYADFDHAENLEQRIGAEVRARIHCGPKPLGYVLFGDVIEFLERYGPWW